MAVSPLQPLRVSPRPPSPQVGRGRGRALVDIARVGVSRSFLQAASSVTRSDHLVSNLDGFVMVQYKRLVRDVNPNIDDVHAYLGGMFRF